MSALGNVGDWVWSVLALLVGLVAGLLTARVRSRQAGRSPAPIGNTSSSGEVPAPPETAGWGPAVSNGTDALVAGLIAAHDLAAGSPALRVHVETVLRGAGIYRLDAQLSQPFDASLHLVVATDDEGARGDGRAPLVTRQVRAGWRRDDGIIRPVEVVVSAP